MAGTIPIVDFSPFISSSNPHERLGAARALVRACREVGFVYIRNHGVPQDQLRRAFEISAKFYALPLEDKMKAPHPPGWAIHRGYSWPGLEKVSNALSEIDNREAVEKLREIQDYKESYEVGSEDFVDMPNVWPPDEVLPEWRPFMTSFYWTCFEAAKKILQALALGLGLEDENVLLKPHTGLNNQLRLLHYPPIPAAALDSEKFARMPTHSDWSTCTLLFQDSCGGLQVESPTEPGVFLDATPLDDTLVLNVGDLLTRWSNGKFKLV